MKTPANNRKEDARHFYISSSLYPDCRCTMDAMQDLYAAIVNSPAKHFSATVSETCDEATGCVLRKTSLRNFHPRVHPQVSEMILLR